MKRAFLLLLSILFPLFSLSGAQPPEDLSFRFRKHQVDDGLSENTVFCILQDKDGFLWFGTKDGLNRFDGIHYRIYRSSPEPDALGNCFIRSMALAGDGRLWLGTDVGVYIMDMESETFSALNTRTEQGVSLNREVHSILIDSRSRVWMGSNDGLFLYEKARDRLQQYAPGRGKHSLLSPVVWSVYEDHSGTIWAGTREGLMKYDENSGMFLDYSDPSARTVGDDEIITICEDNNGTLWAGTWSGGIKRLDRTTKTFQSSFGAGSGYEISHIRTIFDYSDDSLLIGSDDGLYRMSKFSGELFRLDKAGVPHSLSDKNVYSIYKDREGGLWVGTYFGGVNYLHNNEIGLYTLDRTDHSLNGRAVSQFCEDEQGNLWIATEDGGLNYFNTASNTFENHRVPRDISYHNLHALMLEGDELWVGTFSRGIDVCNLRTGRIRHYRFDEDNPQTISDNCVFAIYKTPGGDIYIGTSFGLDRYDRARDCFERVRSVDFYIIDIREDKYGNLWVATTGNGLLRRHPQGGEWQAYTHAPGNSSGTIGHNKVTGIFIDSGDRLWLSTEGGGISLYDYASDSFRTYTDRDGLPNNVVYSILEDDENNLWLSTNRGIYRFNPDDPSKGRHYTQPDGLQSNEFNYRSGYRCRDGRLFFGGINGFNAFYPGDLVANPIEPPVDITSITFLGENDPLFVENINRMLKQDRKIRLPYRNASFTVSYVGMSYISPEKNNYAYRLEGADDQWTLAGNQQSVTYVNLSPGQYTFRVKASNNSGVWNQTGTSLSLVIVPPWWRSRAALLIYTLLFLCLVYYIILYFKRRYKVRSLARIEEFRHTEEKKNFESKLTFFTSIAHEIRTPVSLIKAPLEAVITSGEGSEETRDNLRTIEKNSVRLMELINQLLDFRKLDADSYKLKFQSLDLPVFIRETVDEFTSAARKRGISLSFETDIPDGTRIISDRDALTKVLTNLLSNALKYARETIGVRLSGSGESFRVTVADDGAGIPDDIKQRVFDPFFQGDGAISGGTGIGLSFARMMAGKLNGQISVADNRPAGTVFSFSFTPSDDPLPDESPDQPLPDEDKKPEQPTVLFIDDNPDMRRFVRNNLKKDYHILTAEDAAKGMEVLKQKPVDLLILDIMMPGTDGLVLARLIRENWSS